ncbi:hypothetical protein [Agromyces allii]|uniref:Type IV secretion protein Rhs n=1 Tax=Agromyces allii TaxID=393607 RepID=A0ABP5CNL1_9MICO|nr:hypothetical protein [Agromyces allii]
MARTNEDPANWTPERGLNPLNPFLGKRGFYNAFNRMIFRFTGPAQVGIGRPEAPYVPPADPRCPLCGGPMAAHDIDRSGERTQVHCPPAAASPVE